MIDEQKVAIIGLGYVGLPLAVEFGNSIETIGFDISESRIEDLKKGIDQTLEVNSEDIQKSRHLNFTYNLDDLKDVNVYIVTVPTPIDEVNRPNLNPIINASKMIGKYLKVDDIVIYESTVYPGCTEEVCVPILESYSQLIFNKDFFCGYSPERINPGDKVNTLTKIVKITSGSTPETSKKIDDLYKTIITAGTFKASSIKVAEAAKVIENTQRDLNIALVNELSVIFNRLEVDTLDVLDAAASKWNFLPFKPGLVGGHCIGVDPYYLTHKAEQVGYNPEVILAGRRINDNMALYVVNKLIQKMVLNRIDIHSSNVGVLGITFKENCPDIRNTKVMNLIESLKENNIKSCVVDPFANKEETFEQYKIEILNKLPFEKKFPIIIVAVAHDYFKEISFSSWQIICNNNTVIMDLKGIVPLNLEPIRP